jgi:putative transposase
MGNHVHLLATPETASGLSNMMQALGRRYVAWFNHRHQRTGTLWEGRFKVSVVDTDGYFLACQRYIELNPHRAGLASALTDFRWSSLAHHIGQSSDPLVTDHPLYWSLGNTPFEREAAYKEWLGQGVPDSERLLITNALAHGGLLGGQGFAARLTHMTHRNVTRRPRGRPRKEPQSTIEKQIK